MADPLTEPFEPYQPEPAYDWEYDEEPRSRKGAQMPNVLWGRVAILGALILFAFLLGRITKSSGVPASELEAANDEISTLQTDVETLQDENAALQQQVDELQTTAPATDTSTEDDTATTDDGDTTATDEDSQTYTVKSGDTLSIIAEDFYGDASLDDFIAEANGIDDPTAISVGQELIIPPAPE
jgi:nucleoid-associated protein YgaU